MSLIKESLQAPYTQEQMFDLVRDVSQYKQFLPNCENSQVLGEESESLIGRVDFRVGPFSLYWVSKNMATFPEKITIKYLDGTFKSMQGVWAFEKQSEESSIVSFEMSYDFSSKFVELSIHPLLSMLSKNLVECFIERAGEIYGKK